MPLASRHGLSQESPRTVSASWYPTYACVLSKQTQAGTPVLDLAACEHSAVPLPGTLTSFDTQHQIGKRVAEGSPEHVCVPIDHHGRYTGSFRTRTPASLRWYDAAVLVNADVEGRR